MSETIPARGIPGQSSTSILGNAVLRREDATLIRGRGEYVANQQFEDLLHAHFVRSTTAHGSILSIDVDEALSMPGVVAVYTAGDLGLEDRKPPMGFYAKEARRPFVARRPAWSPAVPRGLPALAAWLAPPGPAPGLAPRGPPRLAVPNL